jgi:hypothetical protein
MDHCKGRIEIHLPRYVIKERFSQLMLSAV